MGGRGAESYDCKKTWPSKNHLILPEENTEKILGDNPLEHNRIKLARSIFKIFLAALSVLLM